MVRDGEAGAGGAGVWVSPATDAPRSASSPGVGMVTPLGSLPRPRRILSLLALAAATYPDS